jgi:hypothetical protein
MSFPQTSEPGSVPRGERKLGSRRLTKRAVSTSVQTSSCRAFPTAGVDGYGPMPGSNIGRTSDSPPNPGQYFRRNSMNSVAIRFASALGSTFRIAQPPLTSSLSANGPSITVISPLASRTRTPSLLGNKPPTSTSVPAEPAGFARELYRRLREIDAGGFEVIVAVLPPEHGLGLAVRDRLLRAAAPGLDSPEGS